MVIDLRIGEPAIIYYECCADKEMIEGPELTALLKGAELRPAVRKPESLNAG